MSRSREKKLIRIVVDVQGKCATRHYSDGTSYKQYGTLVGTFNLLLKLMNSDWAIEVENEGRLGEVVFVRGAKNESHT